MNFTTGVCLKWQNTKIPLTPSTIKNVNFSIEVPLSQITLTSYRSIQTSYLYYTRLPKTAFPTCKCLRQLDNKTDCLPVWPYYIKKSLNFSIYLIASNKGASNYSIQWRVQIGLLGRSLVEELTYWKRGNFRISRIYAQLGASEEKRIGKRDL